MAKETRLEWIWSSWSMQKHKHVYVKIGVSLILMGIAFRLFFSQSIPYFYLPVSSPDKADVAHTTPLHHHHLTSTSTSPSPSPSPFSSAAAAEGKCDLFKGEWIPNPPGPIYNNETCPFVEDHQNCIKNGRPDSKYLYWRWKPWDCDLPPFDRNRFLQLMTNRSWAFIGDSISRNHVQSLLCLLSTAEEAFEVYHDEEYKSKTWHFPYHNFTLAVIWSPFLLKADIFEDINGVSTSEIQLYLDGIDEKWTQQYQNFDYVVISGGKWFLKTAIYWENNTIIGCHYCPGKNVTEVGFGLAYRRALRIVFDFIVRKSDHKKLVFFRTSTPDHFENGEWFNGGGCNRTVPFKEGEISTDVVDRIMRDIELDEFKNAAAKGLEKGVNLKLLDTTFLSLLRPDGHPGPYRQFQPYGKDKNAKVQNDCLHWCLPGPIDSWNDLVMEIVLNAGNV